MIFSDFHKLCSGYFLQSLKNLTSRLFKIRKLNFFRVSTRMISPEQKELSEYVKQVHLSLRCKTRLVGAEKAWEEHLKNEEVLRKYALSMKKLAEFWSINNRIQSDTFLCRIEWVVNYVNSYFQKDLIKIEFEKEFKKMQLLQKKQIVADAELCCYHNFSYLFQSPFKLLDVGSCYNPFGKFEFLKVYPIDLYPANPEVKKCNFIEAQILNFKGDWFHEDLERIPENFFDIVVFSLFLEYLPSPKQRYISCVNAYKCLRINGLLLIVTPDSKHASANALIMKSWKIAAAKIGFVRTKLEKLKYLYCMAFRKAVSHKYPLLLYNIKNHDNNFEEMFVIPQDSVDYKLENKSTEKSEEEEMQLRDLFKELPCL